MQKVVWNYSETVLGFKLASINQSCNVKFIVVSLFANWEFPQWSAMNSTLIFSESFRRKNNTNFLLIPNKCKHVVMLVFGARFFGTLHIMSLICIIHFCKPLRRFSLGGKTKRALHKWRDRYTYILSPRRTFHGWTMISLLNLKTKPFSGAAYIYQAVTVQRYNVWC